MDDAVFKGITAIAQFFLHIGLCIYVCKLFVDYRVEYAEKREASRERYYQAKKEAA